MDLGIGELVVIILVALIFFGPSKLPQLGDALGKGIRNFKRASSGADEPKEQPMLEAPATDPAATPPTSHLLPR